VVQQNTQSYAFSWSSGNSSIAQISGSSTSQYVNLFGAGPGSTPQTGKICNTSTGCCIQQQPPASVNVTVSLTLQTPTFTTQVAGGTATFTTIVTIGASPGNQLPVTFTVTRSAPSNPNTVSLVSGKGDAAAQNTCQITTSAGTCNVQFPIQSAANNSNAGTVTWQFTASTTNTNYGSSGTVTPSPNPLVGTVNFVN